MLPAARRLLLVVAVGAVLNRIEQIESLWTRTICVLVLKAVLAAAPTV